MSQARLRSTVAPPPPTTTQVVDGQPAAPASIAPDVLTHLAPERNTDQNTGHIVQHEWVPDFRFPLISWLYTLNRVATNTMYLSSAYASPASAIGYTIIMYVAMLYHSDASHLMLSSDAARSIMNDSLLSRFFDMLLDLPVPDFAHNEFSSIMAFLPDDIPNYSIITTLACTSYFHDFGRHFSANVFFTAHNLMATLPANTPTGQLRRAFYTSVVNTVNLGQNAAANITPGQLFGRINNTNSVSNWLNERIDAMINSMAIRAVNQNNMVATIHFPQTALADATNYNPYTFLTAINDINVHSITSACNNLAAWTRTSFPASRTLRHYLQPGSSETANYLFTDIAFPTWTTNAIGTIPGNDMPTTHQDPAAIARENGYLTTPTAPTAASVDGITIFNGSNIRAPDPAPASPHYNILSTSTARSNPYVNPIPYVAFNQTTHVLPRTYIFAPYAIQAGQLAQVILSGKWIESGDISAIMQTVPTPATPLFYENSQYHEGAIRLSRTRNALFQANLPTFVQRRPHRNDQNAFIAFFRGFVSGLRLPILRTGPIRAPSARNGHHERTAPGAYFAQDVVDNDHAINVFGRTLALDLQLHATTTFNIWSGLRFRYAPGNQAPVVYVLPSARHIYGARCHVQGTTHPALRIPL